MTAPSLEIVPGEAWDGVLTERGLTDVFLRHGYLRASAILDEGDPTLLLLRSEGGSGVVFPLLVREVPGEPELHDAITPYGFGGPIGFGDRPPWEDFHVAYERWCAEQAVITTFVRFHPLYANAAAASPSMDLVPLSGVVGWRLEPDADLMAGINSKHRRKIRAAERAGLTFVRDEEPGGGERLATLRRLYEETMVRNGASSYYFFPDAYWEILRTELGPAQFVAEVLGPDGDVMATALCFAAAPWAHCHIQASSEAGRGASATFLLFSELARSLQEQGYRIFNIGGGVGGADDGLLRFKLGFDHDGLLPVAVGKRIHDPVAYERLTGRRDTDGFFPAYRSPH